ncbi:MAG: hypothetical protein JXQ83_10385, partial [Candidatus Glassbacteria bacterium]|nr:hypothetical protein [Candidatus Glassbacteria bacterium]
LRKSKQLLFSVLEVIPAAVCLYAPDYSLKYANKTFRKLLGDPEGRYCYEIFHGRKEPCEACPTFRVFETGKPEEREWVNPSGKSYIIYDEPFLDVDNTLLILEMLVDITSLKKAEQELRKSHEELHNLTAYLQESRENERTAMAREIHDELGQALTALKIDMALLGEDIPWDLIYLNSQVKSISALIDSILNSVRRISADLRPGLLDDLGLKAAVEWQVSEYTKRTGTKCRLALTREEPDLSEEVTTNVFRIFQEAMTNIARHAGATEARISLLKKSRSLELKVKDNGYGIKDSQISASKSFGIIGMQERARFCGGKLKISGNPGKGTTLTLSIPLEKAGTDDQNHHRR